MGGGRMTMYYTWGSIQGFQPGSSPRKLLSREYSSTEEAAEMVRRTEGHAMGSETCSDTAYQDWHPYATIGIEDLDT
jgi:hypothetical protein